MTNKFIISDTHFGHKNILLHTEGYRNFRTIEEHDAALLERWNRKVTKRDIVWCLGDMFWNQKAANAILPLLNGRIHLVLGNHDTWLRHDHVKYLAGVYGIVNMAGNVIFSHAPLYKQPGDRHGWQYNVHGHTHQRTAGTDYHLCVSVEQLPDLAPLSFADMYDRISQLYYWR